MEFEDLMYIKLVESQLIKCSNEEIKSKLSKFTQDEKWNLLDKKLNPFEKKDYNQLLEDLNDTKQMMELDEDNPNWRNEFEIKSKQIFQYEKRIVMGYNLNKNINNVPDYNIDDYNEDSYSDMYDLHIGSNEQRQIDNQKNISFTDDENGCLRGYFGFDSTLINCDLNHNYKSESYWISFSENERKNIHELNKERIKNIDNAINKTNGLLVPTVLYHGVRDSHLVDIHTRVGDHIDLKSYISTSYNQKVGKGYKDDNGLYVKFLAPTRTKGVCANDDSKGKLTNYIEEHEYLLSRHNSGDVVNIDYDTGEITILLN